MSKRIQNLTEDPQDQNPFALSTGDLMAGIMFIFILLLFAMMAVQKDIENDKQKKEKVIQEKRQEYYTIKKELYIDLKEEFSDYRKNGIIDIDSSKMSIIFKNDSSLFKVNDTTLSKTFKDTLDSFFPRYIKLITKKDGEKNYRDHIEEIRIEGHTDTLGLYQHNLWLSQGRSRNILNYCMNKAFYKLDEKLDEEILLKDWIEERLTANGLSYSHPVKDSLTNEIDMERSRRIEFRIRTNAEEVLEKIAEENQQ